MTTYESKTIIRSHKLKIKNKFKNIENETGNLVSLLQSCVSLFRKKVNVLVNSNDADFHTLYESLNSKIEDYHNKLFILQAEIEDISEDNLDQDGEVDEVVENNSDHLQSDSQQETQKCKNETFSSQTFCKSLSTSRTFTPTTSCSLQNGCDVPQSELCEKQLSHETLPVTSKETSSGIRSLETIELNPLQYSVRKKAESPFSSQSSFYQSFSSGINANKYSKTSVSLETSGTAKQDSYEPSCSQNYQKLLILPPAISIPSVITASLSHISSPSDFWMQLEGSKDLYTFPTVEFDKKEHPLDVQPGDFCLALSTKVSVYYRAKVLTEVSVDRMVEVFFVDHGSIQIVSVLNLRVLPETAYQIPNRAIHCYLCDILPSNEFWSSASIEKFKGYEGSCKVHVKSLDCDKYGVQLMIGTLGFDLNISEVLCEEGFAVQLPTEQQTSFIPILPKEISNQRSHDSGVSVTYNQFPSLSNQRLCISSEFLSKNNLCITPEPLQKKTYLPYGQTEMGFKNVPQYDMNLMSFESTEEVYNQIFGESPLEESAYKCSRTVNCHCALHLVVPPPSISFVEKDLMLVMASCIVSPSEFYVNPAMEDSFTLDVLHEQMTAFYESQTPIYFIAVEDLKEGMFCAGRFSQDQNWYRVKILSIDFESNRKSDVCVQYVDYGNRASIKCCDLRLLTNEFVQHPSFALKCSLAGIVPVASKPETIDDMQSWSEDAVKIFKELTNYDRCLTAQIVESPITQTQSESATVQVLLWDTVEANDILINEELVAKGVAQIEHSLLRNTQEQSSNPTNVVNLNYWDPMHADFIDVENSYGVDGDEIGSGYKQKDESRVCKYFSLRGGCPKGLHCSQEHLPLAAGGVTRDQEEVYSLDLMPSLPEPSNHVFIQISSVISPVQFYAILPFGSKTVDEVDRLVRQGADPESWVKKEVRALFHGLNEHYSNSPFTENTTVGLSYGTIVAAWRSVDSAWHRGRVIEVSDITKPARIFYVDFGDDEWVDRKRIRAILPQFLHTPFQAVECHLSDVEPLGFEKGKSWSKSSIKYFKEMVSETVLLAHITDRCGKILHLTLRKTEQTDHDKISAKLVSAGFAQYCSYSTSTKRKSNYVPG